MAMVSGKHFTNDGTVYEWRAEYTVDGDNVGLHWVTIRDAAKNIHKLAGCIIVNAAAGGEPTGALKLSVTKLIDEFHAAQR